MYICIYIYVYMYIYIHIYIYSVGPRHWTLNPWDVGAEHRPRTGAMVKQWPPLSFDLWLGRKVRIFFRLGGWVTLDPFENGGLWQPTNWLVVWNMNFIFHNIWDFISQLTNIFQRDWNHQPDQGFYDFSSTQDEKVRTWKQCDILHATADHLWFECVS